ncbi:MAG: HypC/HybG/HupF family hydrogenase formation chaperone [Anaerolinea sp.]|nr:HypC/HybG/HupF family hydrogenase formation chaperone [Anaerolinea sp.]
MCLGYPALVLDVDAEVATVDDRGRCRRASTLLLPDVVQGDWVLVAAGSVVRRLHPEDAADLAAQLARAEAIIPTADPPAPHDLPASPQGGQS